MTLVPSLIALAKLNGITAIEGTPGKHLLFVVAGRTWHWDTLRVEWKQIYLVDFTGRGSPPPSLPPHEWPFNALRQWEKAGCPLPETN